MAKRLRISAEPIFSWQKGPAISRRRRSQGKRLRRFFGGSFPAGNPSREIASDDWTERQRARENSRGFGPWRNASEFPRSRFPAGNRVPRFRGGDVRSKDVYGDFPKGIFRGGTRSARFLEPFPTDFQSRPDSGPECPRLSAAPDRRNGKRGPAPPSWLREA